MREKKRRAEQKKASRRFWKEGKVENQSFSTGDLRYAQSLQTLEGAWLQK